MALNRRIASRRDAARQKIISSANGSIRIAEMKFVSSAHVQSAPTEISRRGRGTPGFSTDVIAKPAMK